MSRSLIEQWLPAGMLGAESLRERGSAKAYPPINFLHVWWARRPLVASRAAVVASLLPAWPSDDEVQAGDPARRIRDALEEEFEDETGYHEWFIRALGILGDPVAGRARIQAAKEAGIKLPGNGYGYERAFTVSPDSETVERIRRLTALRGAVEDPPIVLDPFAGGGSIPFEASRYGLATISSELNPVAVAILEGTIALPSRLGPEFAKVIEHWSKRWAERVEARLDRFFPRSEQGEVIAGYIWAHTVPCPRTGRPTPLAPDFWLVRGDGAKAAVRLDVDQESGDVRAAIVTGPDAAVYGDRSTYKGGAATSIWTDDTFGGEYIREQALAGRLGQMLLAVCVTRPGARSRSFRSPTEADRAAVEGAEAELGMKLPDWDVRDLVPTEPLPEGNKTAEPRRMGLLNWRDMFTPRQLLANVTALEVLREIVSEASAVLSEEETRALGLHLAFALDKSVDYNSRLASWHASRQMVRNTFDRHDFGFKWTFAEFDAAHVLIPWAAKNAVVNHRKISTLYANDRSLLPTAKSVRPLISLNSATSLPLEDQSIDSVVTDPPYYDNVMYGECSDYFYVWLKRSLSDIYPEYTQQPLTEKGAEAVANPALFKDVATHSGRGRRANGSVSAAELADRHYENLLMQSFGEAHRVLKPDGVLTVMFTHKRVDAWDTLGAALLEAGFAIHSSWPIHTESEHSLHQAKKNAASSTIFLTCRKRMTSEPAYWDDIRGDVEHAAEEAALRFAEQGIRGVDLTLATYGPVLSVLSRRWPVYTGTLDAEGRPEILRPDAALDLAREKVAVLKKRGLLAGRDVEFDRVTDWYLLAWSDFEAAEFPSGEALKLSIATHLDLDDLSRQHRVVRTSGGTVTLLSPAERRTRGALDPEAASFVTELDALHALMLVYDEEGLTAAKAWLDRTGRGDDQRFEALVGAALRAIPRVKLKGEYARPEARILESLRTTLFSQIEPPAEPGPPIEQLALETA